MHDDLAILAEDEDHPHHGQLGRIKEWRADGRIITEFCDETGVVSDEDYGTGIYYRHANQEGRARDEHGEGPKSLQVAYLHCGGRINELRDEYRYLFGDALPTPQDFRRGYTKL